jgi:hypothetical protein
MDFSHLKRTFLSFGYLQNNNAKKALQMGCFLFVLKEEKGKKRLRFEGNFI